MVYCSYSDINLLTNVTSNDISNNDVTTLISYATYQLNKDISTLIVRERVEYIDSTRENDIDGVNTTFYVKNWKGKYLGDNNDDGSVTTADLTVVKVASDGTESSVTVSSIDASAGKFTVSSAPTSDYEMYVTYRWSYADCGTPSSIVKMACVLLTAAYCYSKLNFGKATSLSFGNVRLLRHIDAFDDYYKQYLRIVEQINNRMMDSNSINGLGGI